MLQQIEREREKKRKKKVVGEEKNIRDTWTDLHVKRLHGPGVFSWFCKAYLTFDNKFKVRCLAEVTLDYFSSLI